MQQLTGFAATYFPSGQVREKIVRPADEVNERHRFVFAAKNCRDELFDGLATREYFWKLVSPRFAHLTSPLLVPMPRSSAGPLHMDVGSGGWSAAWLCDGLRKVGGLPTENVLRRATSVGRSSMGNREPFEGHLASLEVATPEISRIAKGRATLVLVDDVITSGTQMCAAAAALASAGWRGAVVGLAAGHTPSFASAAQAGDGMEISIEYSQGAHYAKSRIVS